MASGLEFRMTGEVSEKQTFADKEKGGLMYMVRVNWMGGSKAFMVTPEQYAACPESGPVRVAGPLSFGKEGKATLKAERIEPIGVNQADAPAGRRAA